MTQEIMEITAMTVIAVLAVCVGFFPIIAIKRVKKTDPPPEQSSPEDDRESLDRYLRCARIEAIKIQVENFNQKANV